MTLGPQRSWLPSRRAYELLHPSFTYVFSIILGFKIKTLFNLAGDHYSLTQFV